MTEAQLPGSFRIGKIVGATVGVKLAASVVESLCDWTADMYGARDDGLSHDQYHYGHYCPYEAMAAVLRGKPDPRHMKPDHASQR